jgi:hypothetical protein
MRKAFVQHLVPAMLALVFVMTIVPAFESGSRFWTRAESAIDWLGVTVKTPHVRPGDELRIVYLAKVNKQCPSDIRGFIVAEDGTVPVRLPVVSGGYTKPSDTIIEIPVTIKLPLRADAGLEDLKTGHYKYRSIVTRYCYDGVEEDNHTPDAEFHLQLYP